MENNNKYFFTVFSNRQNEDTQTLTFLRSLILGWRRSTSILSSCPEFGTEIILGLGVGLEQSFREQNKTNTIVKLTLIYGMLENENKNINTCSVIKIIKPLLCDLVGG